MNWQIFCHFHAFDAFNLYHCVYYSCISHLLHYFLTNFAQIMSHKISLISCDNRIKLQNIVQYRVDPKKRYRWGLVYTHPSISTPCRAVNSNFRSVVIWVQTTVCFFFNFVIWGWIWTLLLLREKQAYGFACRHSSYCNVYFYTQPRPSRLICIPPINSTLRSDYSADSCLCD